MTEKLLQFIWHLQYFNRNELLTEQGETLQIIQPGTWNTNQGPDFLSAKIRLAGTTWAGNIELHIHTSDWFRHSHQQIVIFKTLYFMLFGRMMSRQIPHHSIFRYWNCSQGCLYFCCNAMRNG